MTTSAAPGDGRLMTPKEDAGVERFVLDLDSNPHPDLLEGVTDAYDDAASMGFDPWDPATIYLRGMIRGMALATGRPDAEFVAWIRHHKAKP